MDCTRGPWTGGMAPESFAVHGVPGGVLGSAINQVRHPCAREWSGLGVVVRERPRPPPTCPTITREVGMLFTAPPVAGVNERLLVRLIVRLAPRATEGTVITTGDQVGAAAATAPVPVVSVIVTVGGAI